MEIITNVRYASFIIQIDQKQKNAKNGAAAMIPATLE